MKPDLDDLELAFDNLTPATNPDRAWGKTKRILRWRLRGPILALVGSLTLLALCVVAGFYGAVSCWAIAIFLVLVVVPERWSERRQWGRRITAIETTEDVRALCVEQAQKSAASVLASSIIQSLLALLYFAVAFFVGEEDVVSPIVVDVPRPRYFLEIECLGKFRANATEESRTERIPPPAMLKPQRFKLSLFTQHRSLEDICAPFSRGPADQIHLGIARSISGIDELLSVCGEREPGAEPESNGQVFRLQGRSAASPRGSREVYRSPEGS